MGPALPASALGLLALFRRSPDLRGCAALHAAALKLPFLPSSPASLFLFNSLIAAYARCHHLPSALSVFLHLPSPDTISFNAAIAACSSAGHHRRALLLLRRLLRHGHPLSSAALSPLLSSLASPSLLPACLALHALALPRALAPSNALLTAYAHCGAPLAAHHLFDEMPHPSVVSWTALISGLARAGAPGPALARFRAMGRAPARPNAATFCVAAAACARLRAPRLGRQVHGLSLKSGLDRDPRVATTLADLYSKSGSPGSVARLLPSSHPPDHVSCTVAIAGLARAGLEHRALVLFSDLRRAGLARTDPTMAAAVLAVVAAAGLPRLPPQVHSLTLKSNLSVNVFVSNGLVNAYFKTGLPDAALQLFEEMPARNVVSWNAVIGGLARHGRGRAALLAYDRMRAAGVPPNDVTFLSLLHGCGHAGEVQRGAELLGEMVGLWGIGAREEHWACLVDMVGRAGLVAEAREVAGVKPGAAVVWQALLGACGIRGDAVTGAYAAGRLMEAAPTCPAAYVQMANIYSGEERWEERARVVKRMREAGARKEPALSWIELGQQVHVFVVGDRTHHQHDCIYDMLNILTSAISDQQDDMVILGQ
ncbi:pentatricopeptide repeat-containing protein At3g05340-like [Wolffia australiana]